MAIRRRSAVSGAEERLSPLSAEPSAAELVSSSAFADREPKPAKRKIKISNNFKLREQSIFFYLRFGFFLFAAFNAQAKRGIIIS
jgi:hypothetical protein